MIIFNQYFCHLNICKELFLKLALYFILIISFLIYLEFIILNFAGFKNIQNYFLKKKQMKIFNKQIFLIKAEKAF